MRYMDYVQINIEVESPWQEQVIADLSPLGFTGFQQFNEGIQGYMTKNNFSRSILDQIREILDSYEFDAAFVSYDYIEDQNWNDAWEQTLTPQFVGKFFIKPSWSEISPPTDTTLLQIDPKMSFGTGYHETTRLVLRKIPEVIEKGNKVLDAGTGTGILAIAAVKMGAKQVFGFDIDEWSYRNATENATLNKVEDRITLALGDQSVIPSTETFDVIIANINRSTILPMLPEMMNQLKREGILLLSGLTTDDQPFIQHDSCLKKSATLQEVTRDGEWICMQYEKTSEEVCVAE